ncbi:P2Y purinoceptor 14 [Dissostichus eleginoides]|uniref:P2Y purinoceptor 14 n=1 Tax=Dissostichus eleginoides TaxID=100907 RepID=A0AAD9CHL3_DISEL|nr:P2Y purinoceptor 14 [Dissostichus eleginoides]
MSDQASPSFNQSSGNKSTACDQVDTSARLFFLLGHSLVFLVGLLLNGFTLKVYFCRAQQQQSSSVTVYLKNLVAADFLISLCLPLRILNYASTSVHIHLVYCNFGASAFYLNMYASILFMGYIAANRYLKIVHPLGTHILQTVRAAHIISTLTWLFLLATVITYVTLSLLSQKPSSPVPLSLSCDALHSQLLSAVYKHLPPFVSGAEETAGVLKVEKLAKSRRNMLVLVSVFCVCFVPYHLVRLPYAFLRKRCSWSQTFFYLKEVTVLLSVLNVCLDPLIYFIFCKAFRAQLNLKRRFSLTQAPTRGENTERRSSDGRMSIRFNRKTSLTTTTRQNSLL